MMKVATILVLGTVATSVGAYGLGLYLFGQEKSSPQPVIEPASEQASFTV